LRTKQWVVALSAVWALWGCADLTPIREYAKASEELMVGKEVVTRWKNSDAELLKAQPLFETSISPRRLAADQEKVDKAAADLLKIHEALGRYFEVLALLADDELPSVKQQGEDISNSIQLLAPQFGDGERSALKSVIGAISTPLDFYRKEAVVRLIQSQNSNVVKLLAVLEQSSQVIESDIRAESEASALPYMMVLGDVRDQGIRFLVRDRMVSHRAVTYQPVLASIQKYRLAVDRVKVLHQKLADSVNADKKVVARLLNELNEARKTIRDAKHAVLLAFNP
jgi:hypothetical protein